MPEPYTLTPFTEDRTPALRAFNQRLAAGGLERGLLYPENHVPRFPPRDGARVYQEQWLLCDSGENVRGGFILTHEQWSIEGRATWAAHLRLPISEGAVDRRFKAVGPLVFELAMARQPNLYALGMGGVQNAYPRRIKSLGWSMAPAPFYFQIFRAGAFLRTSPYLRKRASTRVAARAAAATGVAGAGLAGLRLLARMRGPRPEELSLDQVSAFGDWADEIWERCHASYGLIAPRDSATLNARYPAAEGRFLKLRFRRAGCDAGWAVVLDTPMRGNKYFGDSRVGALVDCLASPRDANAVVAAATEFLRCRGVDLAVANHMHAAWLRALGRGGYLRGPSNYVFALSPPLARMAGPFERNLSSFFVTRGDGAGPERLME